MTEPYSFHNDLGADVRSLISMIAIHGDDLVGAEIGVLRGRSFLTLLHNCPNIKLLRGVDSFEPYNDYLIPDEYQSSEPGLIIDRKEIDMIRYIFYHWKVIRYFHFLRPNSIDHLKSIHYVYSILNNAKRRLFYRLMDLQF